MIAFRSPDLPRAWELAPWLQRIDRDAKYSGHGPLCNELENRLGALCVSSGTAALETALAALALPSGSPVACPSFTYIATATAIRRAGYKPVFIDVDRHTWTVTAKVMEKHFPHVRAAMIVSAFGATIDAELKRTLVPLIIDAAAAYGNEQPELHAGIFCYSMHATKSLPACEGGFIRTTNAELLAKCRAIACFGSSGDSILCDVENGTNAKLSEYHAAIALASFPKMRSRFARFDELGSHYADLARELIPGVHLQRRNAEHRSSFEIALPGPHAHECVLALADAGIEARRPYFPAAHQHPAMSACEKRGPLTNTDWLSARVIGLPFGTHITLADATRIMVQLGKSYKSIAREGAREHANA